MSYNLTSMTNATTLAGLAEGTNSIMGGHIFGYMVILMIFIVAFIVLKQKGTHTAACFAVASWLVTLTVIFFRPMNLIDNVTLWMGILLTPISVFVLYLSGTSD